MGAVGLWDPGGVGAVVSLPAAEQWLLAAPWGQSQNISAYTMASRQFPTSPAWKMQ